ncbi:MAG: FeoB-associated Cys-rich membrane protein [Clostridia bacterium]|nr:FeoB-associated Cys-rich membrane protein [Clostridia bacterium]
MENIIVILILCIIVLCIIWYIIRSKKRGNMCIGCPCAKECGGKCSSSGCGCGSQDKDKDDIQK